MKKIVKDPYIKGGEKDLEINFTHIQIHSLKRCLHNVLWGGGGTDDNEIFASLTRLMLAKIQDENETKVNEKYDFQIFSLEDNEDFYKRINDLYRRALKNILNISNQNESYVVNRNNFSMSKLKFTVLELEKYSFLGGKDILGDLFEEIIREKFKQNKGQFFTHINIVNLILWGLHIDKLTIDSINKKQILPFVIDPSAGSGTFLIEYMKFVTNVVKKNKDKIDSEKNVQSFVQNNFYPDEYENKWAEKYIYGNEVNSDLGISINVNMALHGKGFANIFVGSDKGDGLLDFMEYVKLSGDNVLTSSTKDVVYNKPVNGCFDVIITNPPFSVSVDKDTAERFKKTFIFGEKKNSENLFVERWYQLLKPNGRFGAILPESVFDTTENKYIRLFIYKYFKVKAVVSLPNITFAPFTSTKTSLLLAQKKTKLEIDEWNNLWEKYTNEWIDLKIKCENLLDLTEQEEKEILVRMLKDFIEVDDKKLSAKKIVDKYKDELKDLCKYDKNTKDVFGFVNTWWVFGEVAKELNYKIFMVEVDNIGYKRNKRGEKPMPNELFRMNNKKEILVDDGIKESVLDFLRDVKWD